MAEKNNLIGDVFLPSSPLTKSYIHSTSPHPLLPWTIGQALEQAFEEFPDHEAYVLGDTSERLTFKQVRNKARQFAKGLLAIGAAKYDVLCLSGVKNSDWLYMFFAAQYIGVIIMATPTDRPYKLATQRVLDKSKCRFLVVGPQEDNDVFDAICQCVLDENNKLSSSTSVKHLFCQSGAFCQLEAVKKRNIQSVDILVELGKAVSDEDFHKAFDAVSQEDPAFICPTSGSTGTPKLITNTHRVSVNSGRFGWLHLHGLDKDTVYRIGFLGLWCDAMLCIIYLCAVLVRRPKLVGVVLPSEIENIGEPALEVLEKERCTHCMMWPKYYMSLLDVPSFETYDLSSLRGGHIGGQNFSRRMFVKLMKHFPDLVYIYGCTETQLISTTIPTDPDYERRVSTLGFPVPFYEVKIVNENEQILPINTPGEVWVRTSWGLFWGYYNDPELTASVLKNGWFLTGDIGTLDPSGFITVIGRKSDAIRFKHYADVVYPGPIEDIVRTHPKILEAKIVATKDDRVGDMLHLFATVENNEDLAETDLKTFCDNNMIEYQRPDHIIILKSMPRTGGRNKINGRRLKEMAEENLAQAADKVA